MFLLCFCCVHLLTKTIGKVHNDTLDNHRLSLLRSFINQDIDPSFSTDFNEDELEITINFEDSDLLDHEIFDGSGDYSMYTDPVTFTVPYSPLSTAFISLMSYSPTTNQMTLDAEELIQEPYSQSCPRACRLSELSNDERMKLRGDPGPPGVCECKPQQDFNSTRGPKGEPGETTYLVKLIGKDLPPIRSDVFKEALKQVILMGLKGEKGDPGNIQKKYSANTEFVTISKFSTIEEYRKYIDNLEQTPPLAELILLDKSTDSFDENKILLRFGNSIHNIMSSSDINQRNTQNNQNAFEERKPQQRDAGRYERINTATTHQQSTYNQSDFAKIRALSLFGAPQQTGAGNRCIYSKLLICIIVLIVIFHLL